jgi:hypothetical protein
LMSARHRLNRTDERVRTSEPSNNESRFTNE